jgi:hypothetical protein
MASVMACLVMALKTTRSIFWILQRALLLHDLQDMPGDGLAFAIRSVARISLSAPFSALAMSETASCLGVGFPDHLEISVRIHRSILGWEVTDMAVRGQNLIGGAQILVDRLGLGGRPRQ